MMLPKAGKFVYLGAHFEQKWVISLSKVVKHNDGPRMILRHKITKETVKNCVPLSVFHV